MATLPQHCGLLVHSDCWTTHADGWNTSIGAQTSTGIRLNPVSDGHCSKQNYIVSRVLCAYAECMLTGAPEGASVSANPIESAMVVLKLICPIANREQDHTS